ncbi:MAG: hypothetical protein LBU83_06315 [Bacteroidales bacterium]|jgi:hypothetical protein|nr:hypothetical protein [Bacteroidales bacterium]
MKENNNNSSTDAEEESSCFSKDTLSKADEILFHTQKFLYFNNLMIEECSRWLTGKEKSSS